MVKSTLYLVGISSILGLLIGIHAGLMQAKHS